MNGATLFWTKVAAIGQVAGAVATFAAVLLSLYLAFYARRPRLRLRVGIRVTIGSGEIGPQLLSFDVANSGNRPVHISGIGWHTGWRFGLGPLARQSAVQLTGGIVHSRQPPYELPIGARASSYALLGNLLEYARERKAGPFFTRDWPMWGRRAARIRAYAYTADGYEFRVKPERDLITALVQAERDALTAEQAASAT